MLEQRLIDALKARQVDLFALCSRLVQIPSENPPGDVLPVVRLVYTDGRFFRRAGIPTVVYGPAVQNMGGPDERIETADLLDVACDMLAPGAKR